MATPVDLRKLDELGDYTVASDNPDPRGWEVTSSDGRGIGRVADLVVDTGAMKARYLDVEMDPALDRSTETRHVLVPTESVTIGSRESEQKRISVPLTREAAARAAQSRDTMLTDPERYARDWPVSETGGCHVYLTRGGRNG